MAKIDISTYFTADELAKLLAGDELEENSDLVLYGTHFCRRSKGRDNRRKYYATHKAQERQRQIEYLARPEVKKYLAEKARQRRAGNSLYAVWTREYARRKYLEIKADPVAYARFLEQMKVYRATYKYKHFDELRERNRQRYAERTPEQVAHDADVAKLWEQKNREKRNAQARARYNANPEKFRKRVREYRAKNRAAYNAKMREYRARKKQEQQANATTDNI